jgi:hypothetical protein
VEDFDSLVLQSCAVLSQLSHAYTGPLLFLSKVSDATAWRLLTMAIWGTALAEDEEQEDVPCR